MISYNSYEFTRSNITEHSILEHAFSLKSKNTL